jgi:hypothetical protein
MDYTENKIRRKHEELPRYAGAFSRFARTQIDISRSLIEYTGISPLKQPFELGVWLLFVPVIYGISNIPAAARYCRLKAEFAFVSKGQIINDCEIEAAHIKKFSDEYLPIITAEARALKQAANTTTGLIDDLLQDERLVSTVTQRGDIEALDTAIGKVTSAVCKTERYTSLIETGGEPPEVPPPSAWRPRSVIIDMVCPTTSTFIKNSAVMQAHRLWAARIHSYENLKGVEGADITAIEIAERLSAIADSLDSMRVHFRKRHMTKLAEMVNRIGLHDAHLAIPSELEDCRQQYMELAAAFSTRYAAVLDAKYPLALTV